MTRSEKRASRGGMVTVLLATVLLAVACGGSSSPDLGSGEVVLYTSMPDSIVSRLQGVVEQRFPDLEGNYWLPAREGISLRVVRGRTADLQDRIAEEVANGTLEADVIWLAEPSPYETYKDMGLLAPYEPPQDYPILDSYVDPDGFYVAGRIISLVLAWDPGVLPEGLDDWTDLYDAGPTAFPGPESGAARATIMALNGALGRDFFERHSAGGGVSVASNGAARDGLVAGEFAAVAVLDYMARQAAEGGFAVDYAYPASGTVLIPSPVAITATAANPEAARIFVDFILSRPGQEIVVQIGSFYPVRADVAAPEGSVPLDEVAPLEVDWKVLAASTDQIEALWDAVYGSP